MGNNVFTTNREVYETTVKEYKTIISEWKILKKIKNVIGGNHTSALVPFFTRGRGGGLKSQLKLTKFG